MTNGGSQGLFILVAVVIFGIFVFMSYLLFRDTLKPNLSNVFEDGLVQSEDILGVEKPDKDVSGREDSLYVYAKIRSSYTDSDGINHSDIWAKFFKSGKGGLKLTGSSTSDGNYELGTSDMTGEIKIPNTVNGYAVTEVGYYSFSKAKFTGNFKAPKNLKTIGVQAFSNSLFDGYFEGSNVELIDNSAFFYSKFSKYFRADNAITIEADAFNRSNFTGEFNANKVKTIGSMAFVHTTELTKINAPMLEHTGQRAFGAYPK